MNLKQNIIKKEEQERFELAVLRETIEAMSREIHFNLSLRDCHIYSRAKHMAACKSGADRESCNKCRIDYYRKIAEANVRAK